MERGEGGGFTWGGVEGWGEKAYNCNCITIKKIKKNKKKIKKERTQINKIRNERGKITIHTKEIRKILRKYYKQLDANKLNNLYEIGKFLETYNLPKLNQEESENLNRQITPSEIETMQS